MHLKKSLLRQLLLKLMTLNMPIGLKFFVFPRLNLINPIRLLATAKNRGHMFALKFIPMVVLRALESLVKQK